MIIAGEIGTRSYLTYVLSIRRTRLEDGTRLDTLWGLRKPFLLSGVSTTGRPVIQGSADGGELTLQGI